MTAIVSLLYYSQSGDSQALESGVKSQGIMIGNPVTDNYIDDIGKVSMLGGLGLLPETTMGQLEASGCGSTVMNPLMTEDYNFAEVCNYFSFVYEDLAWAVVNMLNVRGSQTFQGPMLHLYHKPSKAPLQTSPNLFEDVFE